ncbi:hypothetical protein JHK87_023073 [Glycine soja]|nr:hypothetical protein JHK87_023073 [Glycine soja]
MKKMWVSDHRLFLLCILCGLCFCLQFTTGHAGSNAGRTLNQEGGDHQIHCSRERSRTAWKIIQEYLMPFVEKEKYHISKRCMLHPDNDIYRDQEQHKSHIDINEWQCRYCKKSFYEEKHLDQHFDNRHSNLLNLSESQCLADVCGALHCDHEMNSGSKKSKCNPAAAAKHKHLCESLADSCFPVSDGPAASQLHEFFLHQFCDAHSCTGSRKPFSRGHRKKTNVFYIFVSILLVILLLLYYLYIYLYQSQNFTWNPVYGILLFASVRLKAERDCQLQK